MEGLKAMCRWKACTIHFLVDIGLVSWSQNDPEHKADHYR